MHDGASDTGLLGIEIPERPQTEEEFLAHFLSDLAEGAQNLRSGGASIDEVEAFLAKKRNEFASGSFRFERRNVA